MAVEVGIVGLQNAGKTTLFNALTQAGAGVSGKEHVGMASIADDRLPQLAEVVHAKKTTPAAIRVVDVPGTRRRAPRKPPPGGCPARRSRRLVGHPQSR